jgi:hypothetical protein
MAAAITSPRPHSVKYTRPENDSDVAAGAFGRPNGGVGAITSDLRHSRGWSQIATPNHSDTGQFDDPTHVAGVQFIRPRLRDLAARQASGRELTERLRAIAAAYKLFLFDHQGAARPSNLLKILGQELREHYEPHNLPHGMLTLLMELSNRGRSPALRTRVDKYRALAERA